MIHLLDLLQLSLKTNLLKEITILKKLMNKFSKKLRKINNKGNLLMKMKMIMMKKTIIVMVTINNEDLFEEIEKWD